MRHPVLASAVTVLLAAAPTTFGADASPTASAPRAQQAFKILVEDDGVYRVDFEQLAGASAALREVTSERLALTVGGETVPIWVEDGGDGTFGPGDHLEFIGRRLRGERSWVHDYAWLNVYRLSVDGDGGRRMAAAGETDARETETTRPRVRRHLEEDRLLVRLPGTGGSQEDPWFWAKMVHNRAEPTPVDLDLSGLAGGGTVDLAVEVRGWSRPHNKLSDEVADHGLHLVVENVETGVRRHLGVESWNGTEVHRIERPSLPANLFDSASRLLLKVPARREATEDRVLIDVVLLNSVELAYDHAGPTPPSGRRLEWPAGESLRFTDAGPDAGAYAAARVAYGEAGGRFDVSAGRTVGERAAWIVDPDHLRRPAAVVPDAPSALRAAPDRPPSQADYLMIVPHAFKRTIEPLAELHRGRGLAVEVVDVEDVYDEFNHGIAHPRAIRDFIAHAHAEWRAPAPRFVLLVGDASWDVKNAEAVDAHYADWTYRRGESRDFGKNESTSYEGGTGRSRHFIPTWQTSTGQGHAASDHYFADLDGDGAPELAVGRLPVASAEELAAIVRKTKNYVEQPVAGDWRRGVLFVTNEQRRYQHHSDVLAERVEEAGFAARKIYPASSETSNEANTEALIDALGSGQLLVHFIGHGGRYIWRTGPPDLRKNHDLFTLDDLDRLPASDRLPVVLSLTCYSAPFDHPTADSIGEKFLRVEDRGAIGVIAASWRNSPSIAWGRTLIDELTRPGATVGEALMEAKRSIESRMFRETYLLLGDPAVPVASPPGLSTAEGEVASSAPGSGADAAGGAEMRRPSSTTATTEDALE